MSKITTALSMATMMPAFLAVGLLLFEAHKPERLGGAAQKMCFPVSMPEMKRLEPAYWLVVAAATPTDT